MVIQIPELYDCVQLPTWTSQHPVLVFGGALVALIALVFIAYQAYTQYIASKKPYWQVALEDLSSINLPVSSSMVDEKRFYGGLTRILKWYCCNRYGWFLASKTDAELMAVLKELGVTGELLEPLEHCMRTSIQVKFAKDLVSHEQAMLDKRAVVAFIEQSIPTHS